MPQHRRYKWFSIVDEAYVALASSAQGTEDLLEDMVDEERKGATITRILLTVVVKSDTVVQ